MLKKIPFSPVLPILLMSLSLSACMGIGEEHTKASISQTVSPFENKSKCGNEASYTIEGKTYNVLETAQGYQKEGTASWYGASYQGNKTAGCEVFDMFAYTAAHRTLPLPSYVRVTHQGNKKSVIVKVNDRGPFDSQNDIDLSFAAANAIGMVKSKQAKVTIEALDTTKIDLLNPIKTILKTQHSKENKPLISSTESHKANTIQAVEARKKIPYAKTSMRSKAVFYVVAGTYPTNREAVDMFVRLLSIGINKTEMATAYGNDQEYYMVRIGPLYGQDQIDKIKDRLTQDGLTRFKVVND